MTILVPATLAMIAMAHQVAITTIHPSAEETQDQTTTDPPTVITMIRPLAAQETLAAPTLTTTAHPAVIQATPTAQETLAAQTHMAQAILAQAIRVLTTTAHLAVTQATHTVRATLALTLLAHLAVAPAIHTAQEPLAVTQIAMALQQPAPTMIPMAIPALEITAPMIETLTTRRMIAWLGS